MLTNTKPGLLVLLLLVFAVNYVETALVTPSQTQSAVSARAYDDADLVSRIERLSTFEFHDHTPTWAVELYSVAYFIFLPCVGVALLIALARRKEFAPFRVLCLAVAADYALSLPAFVLFPVPERWAYPESNAVLLSDLLSPKWIEAIRRISALNNSFPSTHVSLAVIVIGVCWLYAVRFRVSATALCFAVILSTFALGIHWMADIIAGALVGLLSVTIAWRFTDRREGRELTGELA
jgi:membrane-associated phospholipid phosphatase